MALVPTAGSSMVPVNPNTALIAQDRLAQMNHQLAVTRNNNNHTTGQMVVGGIRDLANNFIGGINQARQDSTNNDFFRDEPTGVLVPNYVTPNWNSLVPNDGQLTLPGTEFQLPTPNQIVTSNPTVEKPVAQRPVTQQQQIERPVPQRQQIAPPTGQGKPIQSGPIGLNHMGSKTKKHQRTRLAQAWKAQAMIEVKLDGDYLNSIKRCKSNVGHENGTCDWCNDYFGPLEFIEARNTIKSYLYIYGNELNNGGICFLLNQDDSLLTDDEEVRNYIHLLRADRGMNKCYGEKQLGLEKTFFGNHTPDEQHECGAVVHKTCVCRQRFFNRGHCDQCWKEWYNKTSFNIASWFISNSMPKRLKKVAIYEQRRSVYARQLEWTSDNDLIENRKYTMANYNLDSIIEVRKVMGLNEPTPIFRAQVDHEQTTTVETGWFQKIYDNVADFAVMSYEKFKEWLKKAIDYAVSICAGSVFSVQSFMEKMKDKFLNFMYDSIFKGIYDQVKKFLTSKMVASIIGLISLVTLSAIGIIKWSYITTVFGVVCKSVTKPIKVLTQVMVKIFKLDFDCTVTDVKRWCSNLVVIAAGLGVGLTAAQKAFALLPFTLRTWFINVFGTQAQKDKIAIDAWKAKALTLLAVRRVPRIVCSDFYAEKLREINSEGFELMKTLEPNRRLEMLGVYNNISRAWQDYIQKIEAEKTRDIPFCVHLAGPAGVGKTTFHSKLLHTLGYSTYDKFSRPPGSEFWDGFVGSKVVVYDEFLINPELQAAMATEFLSLCSSAPFRPPLASVDNIAVGMKGTAATPEIVVTLNNATHFSPPTLQERTALLRRRNVVLEFRLSREFLLTKGIQVTADTRNVDMTKLTPEEIRDCAWFQVRFHDSITNQRASNWMTVSEAMDDIKYLFQQHKVMNAMLRGPDSRTDLSPEEYFQETMKLHYGIPKEQITWSSFLTGTVSRYLGFTAQGKITHGSSSSSGSEYEQASSSVSRFSDDMVSNILAMDTELLVTPDEPLPSYFQLVAIQFEKFVYQVKTHTGVVYFKLSDAARSWAFDPSIFYFVCFIVLLSQYYHNQSNKNATVDFYAENEQEAESNRTQRISTQARKRNLTKGPTWSAQASNSNVGRITLNDYHGEQVTCYFVNIGRRYVLTSAHIFESLTGNLEITLTIANSVIKYTKNVEEIIFDTVNDYCVFAVTDSKFPNIRCQLIKFPTAEEVNMVGEIQGKFKNETVDTLMRCKLVNGWPYSTEKSVIKPSKMWKYRLNTKYGYCGTPIVSVDNLLPGKIIGIHCSGAPGTEIGGATVITRDDLRECITMLNPEDLDNAVAESLCSRFFSTPEQKANHLPVDNILSERVVPFEERVHFPTKTKIKPSLLHGLLMEPSVKQPSVMSSEDPRSKNDPDTAYLERINIINRTIVDVKVLEAVQKTMIKNYARNMDRKIALTRLTIQQAICGIPSYLSSLRTKTSPGYPVAVWSKNGKHECFNILPNGDVVIQPWFEVAVFRRVGEMEAMVKPHNRFLVFFKDELVSEEKILNARTRAIYCNDVVSLVAFRMIYGSLLARLNNSWKTTPLSIGMNQYSTDMHVVYEYLSQVGDKFIAGDYKNYDCCYSQVFQRAAYEIFFALNEQISTPNENEFLWAHEATNNYLQFKDKIYRVHTMHTSGCFLTTIINCFVNELYFRYNFAKRFPSLSFDKNVRIKVLGDDHILCIKDELNYNPLMIRDDMSAIGQTYTSDVKGEELTESYRSFDQITFLGACPRLITFNGMATWVGAPKKSQLWQTPQWTKTNNQDLDATIESCFYLAALWGKEFFTAYTLSVKDAYSQNRTWDFEFPSYEEMQRIAAARGDNCAEDWFRAERLTHFVAQSDKVGLTQILDENVATPNPIVEAGVPLGNSGISESFGVLDFGTDSLVHRFEIKWTVTQEQDTVISVVPMPFGMLAQGQPSNLQNMPFERYLYARCDFEVVLQIAGTPFHQGALIAILEPLQACDEVEDRSGGFRMANPVPSWTFYNHVILAPNTSTTATIRSPFFFEKDWMNTRIGPKNGYWNPVCLKIAVLSKLLTGPDGISDIPINVYSRFPNLKVAIPKPVGTQTTREILPSFSRVDRIAFNSTPDDDDIPGDVTFVAQGNHVSTQNNYNVSNVVGNVPIGTSNQTSSSQSAAPKVQANPNISAIPMDNPPLMSGTVPTYSAYPSRSKVVGISTGVSLGHHPEEMHRKAHEMAALNVETSIENYCSRPTMLGRVTWKPDQLSPTKLFSVPLNNMLTYVEDLTIDSGHWIPSCCFPLSLAQLWRADFKFTFVAAMSDFHSGRLRATVAYGSPYTNRDNRSVYRNEIMDFTSGSEVCSIEIPYNAPTEYLEGISYYQNTPPEEHLENTTFGLLELTVANRLMCPPSVAQSVDVMIFVSASNVKIRELRNINSIRPAFAFVAQSGVTTVVEKEEERVEDFTNSQPVRINDVRGIANSPPCKLEVGGKFEFTISDFCEILRRYSPILEKFEAVFEGPQHWQYQHNIVFNTLMKEMFVAYAGHVQLRYIVRTEGPAIVTIHSSFQPSFRNQQSILRMDGLVVAHNTPDTVNSAYHPGKLVPQTKDFSTLVPIENLYPVSEKIHYIDVRLPYNSIMNFNRTVNGSHADYLSYCQTSPNIVTIDSIGSPITGMSVSLKASDDMRFYVARPCCNFQIIRSTTLSYYGFAGFYKDPVAFGQNNPNN